MAKEPGRVADPFLTRRHAREQRPRVLAHYDAATFVQVIRTGKLGALHPMMPWALFSRMTDEDLGALYAYMRTLKPVKHVVANGVEPTDCAVCGLRHGGDRNGT